MALRDHLRSGTAALVSQGITAGSSLVLQVAALWQLGKAGLGVFAILSQGIIVTFNSVHTGLIGDALAVFDRHEPGIRRALWIVSGWSALASIAVGFGGALLFVDLSVASALLFAAAVLAWTVEETGRRILMARLEFWRLVVNDAVFAVASLATVGAVVLIGRLTIDWLVASMLIGSAAAIVDAVRQLPRDEFEIGPSSPAELRRLFDFAGWRAGQIGIRPLSLLVSRLVIAGVTSTANLGLLEAARLVIAPVLTAANGLGVFLLPMFAKRARGDDDLGDMWSIAGVSAAAAAGLGGIAIVFTPTIGHLLGQDIPTALVASWVVYSIAYCANIPVMNALVARREARSLFNGRLIDAVIGIGLSYVLTSMSGIEAVPVGLAIGIVVGTVWPVSLAVRRGDLRLPSEPTWWRRLGHRARSASRLPRLWPTTWVTIMALLMILGTEYKYRKRSLASALGGSVDFAIILELIVYGLVAAYLLMFVATPPRWRRPTAIQFMVRAYATLMCVSVVYGLYPQLGAVRAVQLVIMVIYCGTVANRASRRQLHQLAHAYMVMITMSVFVGLVWRVPFSINQEHRFNWMHVHSVIAAAMLALAVVIATSFLVRPTAAIGSLPHMPRSVYAFCLAVCTAALIATETRGSLAGAVAGILLVVFFTVPRRERIPVGVVAVLGVGMTIAAFMGQILEYLSRGESTESITTLSNRTILWDIAFKMVAQRPLTGYGLTASRGAFFEAIHLGGAHNAVVNVLVDGGLLATIAWFGIILTVCAVIRTGAKRRDVDAPLLAGLMATLMVNGMTTEGVGSGSGVSALWLLILAAWAGVLQREWAQRRGPRTVQRNTVHPPQHRVVRPAATRPALAGPPPMRALPAVTGRRGGTDDQTGNGLVRVAPPASPPGARPHRRPRPAVHTPPPTPIAPAAAPPATPLDALPPMPELDAAPVTPPIPSAPEMPALASDRAEDTAPGPGLRARRRAARQAEPPDPGA